MLAALDQTGEELADGSFVFAPSDEDIHTAIERRVTELAGDAGAKLHTGAVAQRPGRDRAPSVRPARGRRRRRARAPAPRGAARVRADGRGRLRARVHAPAARAAGAPRAPLPGALLVVRARRRPVARRAGARRRVPAGCGCAGRLEPAARSRRHRRRPRLRQAVRQLARRGVRPRLRGRGAVRGRAHAGAPVAPRRGDRALDQRGVRLPAPRRRVQHRIVDAAAEEEPRHRRAGARQGRPAHR